MPSIFPRSRRGSPESVKEQTAAFYQTPLVLLGIIFCECVITFKFDIDVLIRRKPFKPPLLLYWVTKYGTLWLFVAVNITQFQPANKPLNCQALETFMDVMTGCAMAGASGLLMLRALALWRWDIRVAFPTILLHLGQWSLYLHSAIIVREVWGDIGNGQMGCLPLDVSWVWVQVQFVYAMVFDLIVLCLATWALLRTPGRSTLWKLIFLDGLSYFIVAFLCYLACFIASFLRIGTWITLIFRDVTTATYDGAIYAPRSSAYNILLIQCYYSFMPIFRTGRHPHYGAPAIATSNAQHASTGFEFAPIKRGPAAMPGGVSTHVEANATFDPDSSFTPHVGRGVGRV